MKEESRGHKADATGILRFRSLNDKFYFLQNALKSQ